MILRFWGQAQLECYIFMRGLHRFHDLVWTCPRCVQGYTAFVIALDATRLSDTLRLNKRQIGSQDSLSIKEHSGIYSLWRL
jgi:hypothetical protein